MHKQFHQENNRLEYGSLLYPMPGYKLSFAVGTTYSLDLDALMGVLVSFGMQEAPDAGTLQNPLIVPEAIRRCSGRLALFCNVDGMKLPQEIRSVYALLENSIFTVNLGVGKNFHPKLWIIRYEAGNGEEMIRVIIMSRNLTFDRSMDVAVELSGRIERNRKRKQKRHQPLADFLRFLSDESDTGIKTGNQQKNILSLAEDVLLVNRFEIDSQYEDYRFLPTGFPGYQRGAEDIFSDASSLLVVSPFLSKTVIQKMTNDLNQSCLISRLDSVTPEIYDQFDEVYVPVDGLENDDLLEEGAHNDASIRDLHAKVFYKECPSGNYLYLGSLNATANALYRNVELMLELKFRPYMASMKQVKEDFTGGKNSAFRQLLYKPTEAESREAEEMEDFSEAACAVCGASVSREGDSYCLELLADDIDEKVEIRPLFAEKRDYKRMKKIVRFERLTVKELSDFYAVRKNGQSRVIKVATEGIPREDRDNAIWNSMIDSRPKFLQYIMFLLSDDPAFAIVENDEFMKQFQGGDATARQYISPAIYEKLLQTAAREPEKLEAVEEVMERLDKEHRDADFEKLMRVMIKAVGGR